MAVDTRNKRFSMMSMARPFAPTLPNPDGTLDATDRLQLRFLYAGDFAPIIVVFVVGNINVIRSEARNRMVVSIPREYAIASEDRNTIVTSETRNRAVVSNPRNYRVPTND